MNIKQENSVRYKVLCFHGFGVNAELIKYQLRYFKQSFPYMKFVGLQGKYQITEEQAKYYPIPKGIKSYRWTQQYYIRELNGIDLVDYASSFMQENGPFDGIVAFSQGNLVSILLTMYSSIDPKLKELVSPIKFLVFVGSHFFRFLKEIIEIPSIHIIGREDPVFARGLVNVKYFRNPIILLHNGGHKFPKFGEDQISSLDKFFKQILKTKPNDFQSNL